MSSMAVYLGTECLDARWVLNSLDPVYLRCSRASLKPESRVHVCQASRGRAELVLVVRLVYRTKDEGIQFRPINFPGATNYNCQLDGPLL